MTPAETGIGASGLPGAFRIDREGIWYHEGVEVTHPGVLENLYANLRVEGERYHLQAGPFRVPVEVADTAFVVVRADVDPGAGVIAVHLTDGSRERLRPETLHLDERGVPYCLVKGGRFVARLSVAAWLQVAGAVELDRCSGEPSLVLRDRRFPLRGGDTDRALPLPSDDTT